MTIQKNNVRNDTKLKARLEPVPKFGGKKWSTSFKEKDKDTLYRGMTTEIKVNGSCEWWLHNEKYGVEAVELFGYWKYRNEEGKQNFCRKCYDYFSPIMIEKLWWRRERSKKPFTPQKWFYFYADDEKNQAIENGRQLDYYYQQKAPYHKEIALLREDIEIPSLITINKEASVRYIEENNKGMMNDVYIGDFGIRYCIKCKEYKNDSSDKNLVMSLDRCKLCYDCGMEKAEQVVRNSMICKERIRTVGEKYISYDWKILDKQAFSNEIKLELKKQHGRIQ